MGVLDGKAAIVTGSARGIGRATAELLHAAGARVLITGQNADTLAAAERELPSAIGVLRADARSDVNQPRRQNIAHTLRRLDPR